MFIDEAEISQHLAYIEWYSPLPNNPERNHLLYKVSPQKEPDGSCICSIIPLANIRRSVLYHFVQFGTNYYFFIKKIQINREKIKSGVKSHVQASP
jgi:hypothetical protein